MVVCDGCCCGTQKKHPGIDHAKLVAELRATVGQDATVTISKCVDECKQSNVVVVRPSKEARKNGAKNVWFGKVLDTATMQHIGQWAINGGPGVVKRPKALAKHLFKKTKGTKKP